MRSSPSSSFICFFRISDPANKNRSLDVSDLFLPSTSRTFSPVYMRLYDPNEIRSSDPGSGPVPVAAAIMPADQEYRPVRINCHFCRFTSSSFYIFLPDCEVRSSLQGEPVLLRLQISGDPLICFCRAPIRRQRREPCRRLSPDVKNDPRVRRFRLRHRESPPPLGEISCTFSPDEQENSCHRKECNT